jgi:hypothetical protein
VAIAANSGQISNHTKDVINTLFDSVNFKDLAEDIIRFGITLTYWYHSTQLIFFQPSVMFKRWHSLGRKTTSQSMIPKGSQSDFHL